MTKKKPTPESPVKGFEPVHLSTGFLLRTLLQAAGEVLRRILLFALALGIVDFLLHHL